MNKITRKPVAEKCDNCKHVKLCYMYILQDANSAFVCYNCRFGKTRIRAKRMTQSERRQEKSIREYNEARNKALLEGPDALLLFMKERKLPIPSGRDSLLATYHKTITGVTSLPLDFRKNSKVWLDLRNLHSLDDGDLK